MAESQLFGLRAGPYTAGTQCGDGKWVTGMKVGVDGAGYVRRMDGLFCQRPQEIAAKTKRIGDGYGIYPSGKAGGGGSDTEFHCPLGSYMSDVGVKYNDAIRQVRPMCTDMESGRVVTTGELGRQTSGEPEGRFPCGGYTGVSTTADSILRQVKFGCDGEAGKIRENLYGMEGRARCCMGLEPAGKCGMTPQSGMCDQFMTQTFCAQNPNHPFCTCVKSPHQCPNKFDSRCVANNGYRTADMLQAKCPDVITCQQFVNMSPEARMLAVRVDQQCPGTTPGNRSAPAEEQSSSKMIYFVLFIVILLVGALVGLWATGNLDLNWGMGGKTETKGAGEEDGKYRERGLEQFEY
jgi:hypothetical protein